MEKYIFLDIDGVIATPKTIIDCGWGLTPICQENLGFILKETNAKIVISSSWRLNTVEETVKYMDEQGFLFCDSIVGVTIRAYHYIQKGVHLGIPRGVEIKQYIDTHLKYPWYAYPERDNEFKLYREDGTFLMMRHQELGKDYNYCILDDDTDFLLEHKNYFVQCNPNVGLTKSKALKAIKILNNGN
jgi:hydroxymethylpyrimidine pyrophosphatase-like HAD family hydrolase